MKKLKLGTLDVKALTERELKNVLGGLDAPASTVSTNSGDKPTKTAGTSDSDYGGSDDDWSRIDEEKF
ncbi:MAG: hypothetical protein EOO20_22970 [Chryseobacterium sp.]|nr:MAG: hypothetical protein EOO20_22970 [Chryseobacterium sp.]